MDTPDELAREIKQLKAYVKKTDKTIVELKQRLIGVCEHSRCRYYGDASGNNDTGYECNECGTWSKWGFPNSKVTGRFS